MTLEEILDELFEYSAPHLLCLESTEEWVCSATLRVKVEGGTFEVRSNYNHPTAKAAAAECLDRVKDLLADIHKLAPQTPHKPEVQLLGGTDHDL